MNDSQSFSDELVSKEKFRRNKRSENIQFDKLTTAMSVYIAFNAVPVQGICNGMPKEVFCMQ